MYTRSYTRVQRARKQPRLDTRSRSTVAEDIGVLSYSFHHNNSPACTSVHAYQRLHEGEGRREREVEATSSAERYRFNLAASLRSQPRATLFFSFTRWLVPRALFSSFYSFCASFSLSLSASRAPLPFSAWTAVKQSLPLSPPPLTIRIKPFNCRIVFDGSFSPAKLLFKLVPRTGVIYIYTRDPSRSRDRSYFRSFRLARSLSLVRARDDAFTRRFARAT